MKEPKKRTGLLHTSIGEAHKDKLDELSHRADVSVAELLRRWIDDKWKKMLRE